MRPLRKEMQVVFQDPYGSLSPRLSVCQIIEEGLMIQNPDLDNDERRVARRRGADRGRARPRRAGPLPARVLRRPAPAHCRSPAPWCWSRSSCMLDEPTSALDMSVQAQIVDLLRDLQNEARPRLPVHQPRPQSRARAVQLRHRDEERQSRRGRPGAAGADDAGDRLHARAPRSRVRSQGGPSRSGRNLRRIVTFWARTNFEERRRCRRAS